MFMQLSSLGGVWGTMEVAGSRLRTTEMSAWHASALVHGCHEGVLAMTLALLFRLFENLLQWG